VIPVRRTFTRARAEELLFVLESVGIAAWVRHDPVGALGPYLIEVSGYQAAAEAERQLRELDDERDVERSKAELPPPVEPTVGANAGAYWIVGLILANALTFWALEHSGGSEHHPTLLTFGAIRTPLVLAGQWWRLITAEFLHIGARHLLGNMLLLGVLGALTLRMWGPGRLLFIYVISGLFGNVAGLLFGSAVALKAGASGAILGLMGALAGQRLRQLLHPRSSSRYRAWHILAMLVAFYGFVVGVRPQSDHVAHVGGLVAGALIAFGLPPAGTLAPRRERLLQLALGVPAMLLTIIAGLLAARQAGVI
jgi:rhomboid protease GluP